MAGIPSTSTDRLAVEARASAAEIVAGLVRDGHGGPVFIVATDDSVGVYAPEWAEAFSRVGWRHRVRVLAARLDDHELADLAEEVVCFAPRAVVVAAPAAIVAAVRRIAGIEGVPVVVWPLAPPLLPGHDAPAD